MKSEREDRIQARIEAPRTIFFFIFFITEKLCLITTLTKVLDIRSTLIDRTHTPLSYPKFPREDEVDARIYSSCSTTFVPRPLNPFGVSTTVT